jgi:ABC-type Fe3+-hydroxamate transport system substrate-binding protein
MKKIIFTIEGRRFEIELERDFATHVEENLKELGIAQDRNNEATKLVKAYLTILKENYEATKHIKILLNKMDS